MSKLNDTVSKWIVQTVGKVLTGYAILYGLVIIFGNPARWGNPSFEVALRVPGAPPTWGYILLAGGLVATIGCFAKKNKVIAAGMFIAAAWEIFFAISFVLSYILDHSASISTALISAVFALLFVLIGVAYRDSETSN